VIAEVTVTTRGARGAGVGLLLEDNGHSSASPDDERPTRYAIEPPGPALYVSSVVEGADEVGVSVRLVHWPAVGPRDCSTPGTDCLISANCASGTTVPERRLTTSDSLRVAKGTNANDHE
jgi:hypothetical protein